MIFNPLGIVELSNWYNRGWFFFFFVGSEDRALYTIFDGNYTNWRILWCVPAFNNPCFQTFSHLGGGDSFSQHLAFDVFVHKHEFNNFGDIKKTFAKKKIFRDYDGIISFQEVDSSWILFKLLKTNEFFFFFSPIKQFLSSFAGFFLRVVVQYVAEEQCLIKKFITILVILVTNPVNSLSLGNIQSSSVISLRNFLIPSNF